MGVRLQNADFNVSDEIVALTADRTDIGAVVNFIGICRAGPENDRIRAMTLEHFPEMAQAELERLEAQARERWPLQGVTIIHRFGRLLPGENIVLVATASVHRSAAFEAASFLMDYLKTRAPFWKKEERESGDIWVEPKDEDDLATVRWQQDDGQQP